MTSHPQKRSPRPDSAFISRLIDIVGPGHALLDASDQEPYLREWRGLYTGRTPVVLRPGSTAEVSAILKQAHDANVSIVPQSGNTGLVGGQIPSHDGGQILLSLSRLTALRAVDSAGRYLVAEAGLTLSAVRAAAATNGRLFPLSLASEGSAQIGGNLATNAGGMNVLAYGNTRDLVLGLEVVLADGQIWDGLRALKKDNTGYDLRDLFIGSEGTLGVITAAVLKLFPRPAEQATAVVALPSLDAACALFLRAEARAGTRMTAFEFFSDYAMDIVTRHVPGARSPFSDAALWYVIMEIDSLHADGSATSLMEHIVGDALNESSATDAVLAQSLKQREDLWRLREELSDAQRYEGGSIKHDISVEITRLPEFVRRAGDVVENLCPGARPVVFGHFGDGNVHYNVTQPAGMQKAAYLAMWQNMNEAVHDLVASMAGSISAEHGIGQLKRDALVRYRSATEIDMMRKIKAALDPRCILNPGKVV